MKLYLKTHRYAPELNLAICARTGRTFPIPGIFTIAEARAKLTPKPRPRLQVEVLVTNPIYPAVNHLYHGSVETRRTALDFCRNRRTYHNLPGTDITLKLYLTA